MATRKANSQLRRQNPMKKTGRVYLVGAGPGDARLLTLRGAELLGLADVVVYDSLVNPDLLRLAPATAELIARSREGGVSQEELNTLLVTRARAGKCVVRLKGGDPYVFGRGGEEAEELAKAGIDFEVVPGVSSVTAVPNYAGIPLTHRAHCSSFTVFTGHQDPDKEESSIDWSQLARTPGTKVILMGAERIGKLAAALVANGMPGPTPVAMVRCGTTGQQQTISGTLADIGARASEAKLSSPVVTIIGDVVTLRSKLNWFEARSLFGQRIVVTRAHDQAAELSRPLLERGADVMEIPCIKLAPPTEREALVEAMAGLNSYDWIVFTSTNGVTSFFTYFFQAFEDLRDIGGVRLAAVGPSTAEKLRALHLKVDVVPKDYTAKNVAKAMAEFETIENRKILLLRAEVATRDLPKLLEDMGAIVDDVACYRTVGETAGSDDASTKLRENGADWLTFTSGSTVEHFHARFDLPKLTRQFPSMRVASIGPETTKTIAALGLKPDVEPAVHTLEGLVAAIEKNCRSKVITPR